MSSPDFDLMVRIQLLVFNGFLFSSPGRINELSDF